MVPLLPTPVEYRNEYQCMTRIRWQSLVEVLSSMCMFGVEWNRIKSDESHERNDYGSVTATDSTVVALYFRVERD